MTTPILLTSTLVEGDSGYYDFSMDVSLAFLTTLTVTYYDVDTLQVINGREHQNVLNTNGGTVTTDQGPPVVTSIHLELTPADTIILNETRRVEYRILDFRWTWDQGIRHSSHTIQFGLENTEHWP